MNTKFPEMKHQKMVVKTSTPDTITSVKLQSLLDARLSYNGPVTGKHYVWAKAGSVVVVDVQDAPALLEKRIKVQSCCNGSDNAVFQKID